MTIALPDRAVRDYLTAFNLGAVFIVAPKADTPCDIGVPCRCTRATRCASLLRFRRIPSLLCPVSIARLQ
jgi:hypothetical protein